MKTGMLVLTLVLTCWAVVLWLVGNWFAAVPVTGLAWMAATHEEPEAADEIE